MNVSFVMNISTHTLTRSVTLHIFQHAKLLKISTHTLTRSVTAFDDHSGIIPLISTHTLTRSVTITISILFYIRLNFNSHAHEERDSISSKKIRYRSISTHTLTRSVTPKMYPSIHVFKFQLTRSRGA